MHAAVISLEEARALEPSKGSVREALARAYFRSGRYSAAESEFQAAVEIDPVNDYAHFGLGLCRLKAGDRDLGRAATFDSRSLMRPDNDDYQRIARRPSPPDSCLLRPRRCHLAG